MDYYLIFNDICWDIVIKVWIYLDIRWIDIFNIFYIYTYIYLYLGESFGSVWILTRGGRGLLLRMTPSDNVLPAKQNILSFWISSKMKISYRLEFQNVLDTESWVYLCHLHYEWRNVWLIFLQSELWFVWLECFPQSRFPKNEYHKNVTKVNYNGLFKKYKLKDSSQIYDKWK